MPFTDHEMAQTDAVATQRAQAQWREETRCGQLFSVHTTFVTGSLVRTEVWARDEEDAKAKQRAKLPPGVIDCMSAWPVDRSVVTVNVGGHRNPIFDSSFGCLV